jgi:hypothetical protein
LRGEEVDERDEDGGFDKCCLDVGETVTFSCDCCFGFGFFICGFAAGVAVPFVEGAIKGLGGGFATESRKGSTRKEAVQVAVSDRT